MGRTRGRENERRRERETETEKETEKEEKEENENESEFANENEKRNPDRWCQVWVLNSHMYSQPSSPSSQPKLPRSAAMADWLNLVK